MTQTRRIVLNVLATYGRSLYALAIGLFCGRWTLMSLGQVDYGLYGVVGGVTGFISFLNSAMATSVSRYFAFSVGVAKADRNGQTGIENCRRWFSVAVLIHVALPLLLVIVGYPVGCWAVRDFLTIPADRIQTCIWVWRFVCLSCFVAMCNVPFAAMYNAKQEIAELTLYGVVASTCNVIFLYHMVTHPGVWLGRFAAWTCLLSIVPQLLICGRALQKYPECKFVFRYAVDLSCIRELTIFALYRLWGTVSMIFSGQGMSILINKLLGPVFNAAMAIGNTVASHTMTLSGSLSGAFSPALTNAAGEGDLDRMRSFAFKTCRFGTLLMLVFAIPVALEANELLILWLKDPPALAAELCICVLISEVFEKMTDGHWMSIFAIGNIARYQIWMSVLGPLSMLLAWALILAGWGLVGVGVAQILNRIAAVLIRLVFGRRFCALSIWMWLRTVLCPVAVLLLVTLSVGVLPRFWMAPSFCRVCLTTSITLVVFLPLALRFVLSADERALVFSKVRELKGKVC